MTMGLGCGPEVIWLGGSRHGVKPFVLRLKKWHTGGVSGNA